MLDQVSKLRKINILDLNFNFEQIWYIAMVQFLLTVNVI